MKHIKTIFALIFAIGALAVSQSFACTPPSGNSVTRTGNNSVLKAGDQPIQERPDPNLRGYSRGDLVGRYASLATATFFDPASNRTAYASCVGVVTFDGHGRFTDKEVHSYDGVIVRDEFTGTYTIQHDGRGIMHFVGENEEFDYEFVVANDVKDITYLITLDAPGVVSFGTLKKQ